MDLIKYLKDDIWRTAQSNDVTGIDKNIYLKTYNVSTAANHIAIPTNYRYFSRVSYYISAT